MKSSQLFMKYLLVYGLPMDITYLVGKNVFAIKKFVNIAINDLYYSINYFYS